MLKSIARLLSKIKPGSDPRKPLERKTKYGITPANPRRSILVTTGDHTWAMEV